MRDISVEIEAAAAGQPSLIEQPDVSDGSTTRESIENLAGFFRILDRWDSTEAVA